MQEQTPSASAWSPVAVAAREGGGGGGAAGVWGVRGGVGAGGGGDDGAGVAGCDGGVLAEAARRNARPSPGAAKMALSTGGWHARGPARACVASEDMPA